MKTYLHIKLALAHRTRCIVCCTFPWQHVNNISNMLQIASLQNIISEVESNLTPAARKMVSHLTKKCDTLNVDNTHIAFL